MRALGLGRLGTGAAGDRVSPSFGRVLAGALAGSVAASFLTLLAQGRFGLYSWPCLLVGIPFGAILGVRLAIGQGGTARWVALLASWAVWAAMAWGLFWPLHSGIPWAVLLASGIALVGGWASLVWRSLSILSGGGVRPGTGALFMMGFATGRALHVGGEGLLRHLMFTPGIEVWMFFGCVVTITALSLTCGVGVQASLAARMDQSWAGVTSSAGVLGVLAAASFYALHQMSGAWGEWMFLPPVLIEVAWFAWWGQRLAQREDDP